MGAKHRTYVDDQATELGLARAEAIILGCIAQCIQPDKKAGGWMDHSFPGIDTLCRMSHYSKRYVIYILRKLEKKGALKTESIKGGWRYHTVYRIPGILEGAIILEPPAAGEAPAPAEYVAWQDRGVEERLRYCKAMYKQTRSDRRQHWADEIAKLEAELGISPPSNDQAEASAPQPASRELVPLQQQDKDTELIELEALYIGTIQMQAQWPRDSPEWLWYQQKLDQIGEKYNQACQDRGIILVDQVDQVGDPAPIDPELEAQIQEHERIVALRQKTLNITPETHKDYEKRRQRLEEELAALNALQMRRGGTPLWLNQPTT